VLLEEGGIWGRRRRLAQVMTGQMGGDGVGNGEIQWGFRGGVVGGGLRAGGLVKGKKEKEETKKQSASGSRCKPDGRPPTL